MVSLVGHHLVLVLSLLLHLAWIDGVNLHSLHYYLITDWQCVCWGYYAVAAAADSAVVAADSQFVTAIANIYVKKKIEQEM